MNDLPLIEAIRVRAVHDARAFREKFPNQTPNERWLDNSFAAALPLAASDAGVELQNDTQPELLMIYRTEIASELGSVRPDRGERRDVEIQEPTPGEN